MSNPSLHHTEKQTGRLWQIADTLAEAQQWKVDIEAKGGKVVDINPVGHGNDQRNVIIELNRDDADRIMGYPVEADEWLDEE